VKREHRGNSGGDRGQRGRRMPVVQMGDIGASRLDERRDGARKSKESLGVIQPTPPVGL